VLATRCATRLAARRSTRTLQRTRAQFFAFVENPDAVCIRCELRDAEFVARY
jgi:hypothetical protein